MAPDSPPDPQTSPHRVQNNSQVSTPNGSGPPDGYAYYPSRDEQQQHQNGQTTEQDSNGAPPMPYPPMPMFPYPGVVPPSSMMPRPKRTQCKNACVNCQKACKKCDDNRPCQRCIRYGTAETCVDSQRKERKKGVKRGPYKKRDGKGHGASDGDNDEGDRSQQPTPGPAPGMPYVGPVGYPPGMWSTYPPTGPGGKLEPTGFYQPVFALTPVGGPPPQGGEGGSASGGNETPHFPVGFYPATFISYPGPFPPYAIPPQAPGTVPHGFHFAAYPPPVFAHRPQMPNAGGNDQGAANGVSASVPVKGNSAGTEKESAESQVNGQVKASESQGDPSGRETD